MFQRVIDDLKESTGNAVRLSSLAAAAGVALLVTVSFLCAAAFIYVLQNYGVIQACLTGAVIFLAIAIAAASSYMLNKRLASIRAEEMAKENTKSAVQSILTDPVMLAAGLQVVRAIGIKRLIPILAVGGVALGVLAGRRASAEDDSEQ